VRIQGRDIRDGRYHGWIERDDPTPLGRIGDRAAWNFPSFFSQRSNVDNSSVSSLACGNRVICVANYEQQRDQINISSSQGPTRDNRLKPDVAAPGTDVVAASGFTGPDDLWVSMTGTSMASPFVTGLAGLMLAVEPRLTAAQIEGIIHRTSRPLPGASHEWSDSAGFGVINPEGCLTEAANAMRRREVVK
jgi:subtilisin family serine protease